MTTLRKIKLPKRVTVSDLNDIAKHIGGQPAPGNHLPYELWISKEGDQVTWQNGNHGFTFDDQTLRVIALGSREFCGVKFTSIDATFETDDKQLSYSLIVGSLENTDWLTQIIEELR